MSDVSRCRFADLPFRAALSVSGPSSRVTMEQVGVIAPGVQAVAEQVSAAFKGV